MNGHRPGRASFEARKSAHLRMTGTGLLPELIGQLADGPIATFTPRNGFATVTLR